MNHILNNQISIHNLTYVSLIQAKNHNTKRNPHLIFMQHIYFIYFLVNFLVVGSDNNGFLVRGLIADLYAIFYGNFLCQSFDDFNRQARQWWGRGRMDQINLREVFVISQGVLGGFDWIFCNCLFGTGADEIFGRFLPNPLPFSDSLYFTHFSLPNLVYV